MRWWPWLAAGLVVAVLAVLATQRLHDRLPPDAAPTAEAARHGVSSPGPRTPSAPKLSGTPRSARPEATPPSTGHAAAAPERVFEGIVVDRDGHPVPGAEVLAWSDFVEPPAIADDDGRFRLVRRREQEYVLVRGSAPGLVAEDARLAIYVGEIARVVLVPGTSVRVEVRDAGGQRPVPSARVLTLCGDEATGSEEWRRQANYTGRAVTDADGVAVVLAHEGMTRLLISAPGFAPVETEPRYVPAEGASFEISLHRGGSVEVVVVDPTGRPVPGATVHLVCGGAVNAYATTDPTGRARFEDLPSSEAGRMHVSARTRTWTPVAREVRPPEPGGVRTVEVRVDAGRTVTGTARFADGRAVAGAEIHAKPTTSVWSRIEHLGDAPHRARTDAEGGFRLEHVAPGELSIWAFARSKRYAAHCEVTVPAEGPVPVVELVEDRERGGISLVVRVVDADGQPVTDACVDASRPDTAEPEDDGFIVRELTDEAGRARFRGLPARPLRFTAFSDTYPLTPIDVDLAARAPREVELRMAGGAMEGTVRFPDGTPARVELYLEFRPDDEEGWRSGWPRVDTDPEGRFRFQGLPDGTFSIRLCTDGLRLVQGPRTFRAGETCEWVVASDDGSVLPASVEVVDAADRSPVEGDVEVWIDGAWLWFDAVEGRPGVYASPELIDPGAYSVRVRLEGFLDTVIPDVVLGGTGTTRIAIRPDVGAVLQGLLLRADGQPARYGDVAFGDSFCEADENGHFRLTGLPDGEVEVEIRGEYIQTSKRKVTVDRSAPAQVTWRFEPAGTVVIRVPRSSIPDATIEVRVHARHAAQGLEEEVVTYVGSWHRDHAPGEAWVAAVYLPGREPGRWRVEMRWGDEAWPPVEVTVVGLDRTELQLAPP